MSESLDVERATQIPIQSAGAGPGNRVVWNPEHPVSAWSWGPGAPWHQTRPFGIGTGPAAQRQAQSRPPHDGAAAGEAGPPGYARHPDYLVPGNSRTAQNPLPTRRSGV